MQDLNVVTVTQNDRGSFEIKMVTQSGEFNNSDFASWALQPPFELPKDALLDIITLLSRALMHINQQVV